MPAITSLDLENAKTDVDHLAAMANSTELTTTDRFGRTKRTLAGIDAAIDAAANAVLGGIGYVPPVTYAAGILMNLTTKTVEYAGEVYAPKLANIPFTTTTWATDSAKFRLIQGVASTDLAASGGSSLSGFLAAGVGAVPTTAQEKMRQHVSVKDYGGAPGAGDNATAFDRAFAVSSLVEVPPGTWRTSKYVDEHKLFGPGTVVCYNTGWDRTLTNKALTPWERLVSGVPRTLSRLKAKKPTKIVFTGDSVTWGQGVAAADSYTAAFARLMAAAYPDATVNRYDKTMVNDYYTADVGPTLVQTGSGGWTIDVVRNGIGGNNVPRIMARSFGIFGNSNGSAVDCAFIMAGINDSLEAAWANQRFETIPEYERALDALVREIRRFRPEVDIVFLTPTWYEDTPNQRLDGYAAGMKRVAADNRIPVVDTRKLFLDHYVAGNGYFGQGDWFFSAADFAHPSGVGHTAIAQRIYDDLFSAKAPAICIDADREKSVFVPVTEPGFFTYSGTWQDRGPGESAGFEGTDFPQLYTTTTGGYVEFTTTASELYALLMTIPTGAAGPTNVEMIVNGNVQRSYNLQSPTVSDDANTNFTTAPRQRFLIYKNGDQQSSETPYTVRIKNTSGGTFIFDGIEAYNDKRLKDFTQMGAALVTDTVNGNYSTRTVVFPEPFRKPPTVVATSNDVLHHAVVDHTTVTKTGFVMYCAMLDGSPAPVGLDFSYIASTSLNKSV